MSSTGTHRRALRWGGLTEAHAALRRLRHVPPSPGGASRQLAPRCGSPADPPAALYLAQDVKSVAWHPHGEVLVSAGSGPQLVVCDLDIGSLEAVRKTLPVLGNRVVIAQTGRIVPR